MSANYLPLANSWLTFRWSHTYWYACPEQLQSIIELESTLKCTSINYCVKLTFVLIKLAASDIWFPVYIIAQSKQPMNFFFAYHTALSLVTPGRINHQRPEKSQSIELAMQCEKPPRHGSMQSHTVINAIRLQCPSQGAAGRSA